MRIVSAISTMEEVPAIAQDLEAQLRVGMTDERPADLLMVFVSAQLAEGFEKLVGMLRKGLGVKNLVAVTGESILGNDQEIERVPGVSAMMITLKDDASSVRTFHLSEEEWPDLLTERELLRERLLGDADEARGFVMLADPFTTPIMQLLEVCSAEFPRAPVIGGMASGMSNPGEVRLAINDTIHTGGVAGVTFAGNIEMDVVVSQGCRPIGTTFAITKGHKNIIEQLDGKPALIAIEEMVEKLSQHDRQLLASGGLQIGRVIDEGKGNYGRGDFLIRTIMGVRRESGAILIWDLVQPGQTLQFHVRDAKTADEEMRLLLEGETMLAADNEPALGVLLFTCNSRGTRLFDMPHHDITVIRQMLGAVPAAGFFAAGEFGPVGEKNFIHGHTASMAIFREPAKTV